MKNDSKFGLGVVIGAVVGAAAGIFLAPKSGKENREVVMEKFTDLKKAFETGNFDAKVQEIFGQVTDQTREWYRKSTDVLVKRLDHMKDAVMTLDKGKYVEIVGQVIEGLVEEKQVPKEEMEKLRKYLESDYKKIVEYQEQKKRTVKKLTDKNSQ
jgi:gas vesicle protein